MQYIGVRVVGVLTNDGDVDGGEEEDDDER